MTSMHTELHAPPHRMALSRRICVRFSTVKMCLVLRQKRTKRYVSIYCEDRVYVNALNKYTLEMQTIIATLSSNLFSLRKIQK